MKFVFRLGVFIPIIAFMLFAQIDNALFASPEPDAITVNTDGQKTYALYPKTLDELPDIPSPFTTEYGMEIVVVSTGGKKYALIPVTVANRPNEWKQLEINAKDFQTLARIGLHSEIELDQVKTITGRSISEITEIGRPERSSTSGFMANDEDIISVLKGDNRLVRKLGLTHPQMAKPLFHIWNLPDKKNIEFIRYNGKQLSLKATGTKGWQESIFNDEIKGAWDMDIVRELDQKEKDFLREKYSNINAEQMAELVKKLSHIHTGEMEAYYVMRYGFYEGHDEYKDENDPIAVSYRVDPIAIAFVFGLRSINEIENAFEGKLYKTFTEHFTRENISSVLR